MFYYTKKLKDIAKPFKEYILLMVRFYKIFNFLEMKIHIHCGSYPVSLATFR